MPMLLTVDALNIRPKTRTYISISHNHFKSISADMFCTNVERIPNDYVTQHVYIKKCRIYTCAPYRTYHIQPIQNTIYSMFSIC